MKEYKFYKCSICGNIAHKAVDHNTPLSCCGKEMAELIPGTTDASLEKHVPVISIKSNTVTVTIGEAPHPMLEEHHISFIALITNYGIKINNLTVPNIAETNFELLENEKVEYALEYCNLHGLWKKENN